MTSAEWCALNLSDQEEHLAYLSRLAQLVLSNEKVYVELSIDHLYGWQFIVLDEHSRSLVLIRNKEALKLGEHWLCNGD